VVNIETGKKLKWNKETALHYNTKWSKLKHTSDDDH